MPFLAGRFAAKEAVRKVSRCFYPMASLSLLPDAEEKLRIYVRGRELPYRVSLSHERAYAVAVAVAFVP